MTKGMQETKIPIPVLVLWEDILLVTIFGVVDSKRAQELMETALARIWEVQSRIIILDIRAVPSVDTAVANHFIKISQATKLMGCQCIISGLSPAIAQTIAGLEIDLGELQTRASLLEALELALEMTGLEVVAKKKTAAK